MNIKSSKELVDEANKEIKVLSQNMMQFSGVFQKVFWINGKKV